MLLIERRFNGPPDSGNGGYSCGTFGTLVDGPAEVTLRVPPPLDTPFDVAREDGVARVLDGETLVAEVRAAKPDIEPPERVSLEQARASETPIYAPEHPFPTCFVCGPDHRTGLRIFAGPVNGRTDLLAAPWTPASDLGDGSIVRPEFVWASLDCPGGNAAFYSRGESVLLGRMTAELRAPVRVGEPHVAIGWPLGAQGRKLYAGSALYDADGELKAVARATWIALR